MKYTIKISYQTGDSLHSEDVEQCIEYEWSNLHYVQESLRRIGNHYKYYRENNNLWEKPKGVLPEGVYWDNRFKFIGLELIDDNGNPFKYSDFWTGYFEILYSAEIIISDNYSNKFYFN